MYSKHSGGCWEQCRRASRGGGGRAISSPCRPLFVSHGSARVVVRGLLVHRWSDCCSVAGPSLVHRWSIARLAVRLAVPLSLVHCASVCSTRRSCIAGPSLVFQLVHRWSICWCIAHPSVPLSLVHRASLWLLLCPSCIADASLVCLLVHRSSVCLCTARPSDGPSVGVTIAAASLGRRVPHQWKARMLFWCCRRRNREGL